MKASRNRNQAESSGQRLVELVADIGLPFAGLRLAVHPDADEEQDRRGEQRAEALGQLAAGAADRDEVGRRPPGREARGERGDPAEMDPAHHVAPVGLAQEGDHRDDDQQRLQPLAQQDGEGAEEGRGGARPPRAPARASARSNKAWSPSACARTSATGAPRAMRRAQPPIARSTSATRPPSRASSSGLDRLEAVEIGGQRELGGARAVAAPVGGEALRAAVRARPRASPGPRSLANASGWPRR